MDNSATPEIVSEPRKYVRTVVTFNDTVLGLTIPKATCVCCLQAANDEKFSVVASTSNISIKFPLCQSCSIHSKEADRRFGRFVLTALICTLPFDIYYGVRVGLSRVNIWDSLLFVAGILLALLICRFMASRISIPALSESCSCQDNPVKFSGSTLSFTNSRYAKAVANLNVHKKIHDGTSYTLVRPEHRAWNEANWKTVIFFSFTVAMLSFSIAGIFFLISTRH